MNKSWAGQANNGNNGSSLLYVSGLVEIVLVSALIIVCASFIIVTERKGLGMFQLRQGPNNVGLKGLLQPLADGVNLFKKEFIVPTLAPVEMYVLGPILCFICAYSLWIIFPCLVSSVRFELGLLFFLCVSSFSVYGVFLVGWICDSRYAFIGAIRAVAQSVSYEVFLSVCVFCPLLFVSSFDLVSVREVSYSKILCMSDIFVLWFLAMLAETNRAPFDFVEGESELVAGYTVEYGGVGFALIALAEYSNIMFISLLTGLLFFGGVIAMTVVGSLVMVFAMVFFSFCFIWLRATVPRYRYDLLIMLCWLILLPISLGEFLLFVSLGL